MISLFLEPIDVWLFRDGRPFDAGTQHRAESVFPPFGTVMAGAIRSFQLARQGIDLANDNRDEIRKTVGDAENLNGLRLAGPLIARWDDQNNYLIRYYPQPADAISSNNEEHRLRPASGPAPAAGGLLTSRTALAKDAFLLGASESLSKGENNLWLDEAALVDYLNGKEVCAISQEKLFQREVHTGIGMQTAAKITREGMLYEVEFIRPCASVGLWLGIAGDAYQNWPQQGVLQLGGESRAAAFRQVRVDMDEYFHPESEAYTRLRVYLATPAYFSQGWKPDHWNTFFNHPVTLRAAAVNRFMGMGGFDLAAQDHKAARRFVPAGSVYYFEAERPVSLAKPFTEWGQDFGLGHILVGRW